MPKLFTVFVGKTAKTFRPVSSLSLATLVVRIKDTEHFEKYFPLYCQCLDAQGQLCAALAFVSEKPHAKEPVEEPNWGRETLGFGQPVKFFTS